MKRQDGYTRADRFKFIRGRLVRSSDPMSLEALEGLANLVASMFEITVESAWSDIDEVILEGRLVRCQPRLF